ncbi:MAG: hypothetical protein BWY09_01441 [Candidatus Hydrogenedentes bacterium ADurb.Bin179]|nr:MAG: hypothetical protein BWY09_01441 [Candidatus Hydrogenedentes bacterium ADurb.Bin179]
MIQQPAGKPPAQIRFQPFIHGACIEQAEYGVYPGCIQRLMIHHF